MSRTRAVFDATAGGDRLAEDLLGAAVVHDRREAEALFPRPSDRPARERAGHFDDVLWV